MQQAVIFGAGSVGRGFVGELFCEAGLRVTFLDVDPNLVGALAREGSYPHVTVSNTGSVRRTIGPVTAIDSRDVEAAVSALVAADVAATAVGGAVLPRITPLLAQVIARRIELGRSPLNVLLCENLHGAAGVVRNLIASELPSLPVEVLDANMGLLETSIGRMIPVPDLEVQAVEPTVIFAEPYRQLPYDRSAVRGAALDVPGLVGDASVPFAFYGDRKLYVHNLGHAFTAYLGETAGVTRVWEAIAIPELRYLVRAAMVESALALSLSYRQPLAPLLEHVDDLIHRFGNRALGDTVERVGRDPIRKTAPGDRLLGAYVTALSQQTPSRHLSLAVAAGADALRRHEDWSEDRIRAHLDAGLAPHILSGAQQDLLDVQISGLGDGCDLERQIDLIDATYEPSRCCEPRAGEGVPFDIATLDATCHSVHRAGPVRSQPGQTG